MKKFVVYDGSGRVLRSGTCATEDFALQAAGGEFILEGVADDATQMIVDRVVVNKPEPSDAEKTTAALEEVRLRRDTSLASTDWTQTTDSPLTAEQRSEWQMYRQALRDLPADYSYITSLEQVTFPDVPS